MVVTASALRAHPMRFISLALALGLSTSLAQAATSITSTDGLIKVDVKPVTPLSSSDFDTALFGAFPGWTVTQGASASGSLTHSNYTPRIISSGSKTTGGGAQIFANYTHPSTPPTGKQFQFIQIASTTGFGTSYATPHLDPLNNDDTLPFYWTTSEAAGQTSAGGKSISFSDAPQAPFSGLKNGPVSFSGKLFVSEWDGAKDVTVRNGFSWGYDMTLATDGKSVGSFNNPSPSCAQAVCTGTGTSAFTWGSGVNGSGPSSLSFTSSNFTPVIDQKFEIGTLTFFNGTIASSTGVNSVDLAVDLYFGFGTNFGTPMRLDASMTTINTPNGGVDPYADADAVSFASGGFTGNFNVFEGQSASLPLYAKLSSSADVLAEKNLGDASFSGLSLEFAGFGAVTGGGFVTSVPEPSQWALTLLGLAVVWSARTRRSSAA